MAHLKLGAAVLLLLFLTPLFTEAQHMSKAELDSLQAIWAEWNKSTPNLGSNLAGWDSNQKYPCRFAYSTANSRQIPALNWRGIQCIEMTDSNGGSTSTTVIIGLRLHNASIEGTLPPQIGNITYLSTLELTGNPKLTGPLPPESQNLYLQTMDLHDNAFNGILPDFSDLDAILNVNLFGNEFVGEFHSQIQNWVYIQTLNLARNQFNDSTLTDAFRDMKQFISL